MTMNVFKGLLLLLLALPQDPGKLVLTQRGQIPVILTAPHGGTDAIPGAAERKSGVVLRDQGTREIAESIARLLEEKLGGKPYLVCALFHRKYADANRKEDEALEDPLAKPPYHAYHAKVREYVDEIRRQWPQGAILLDVHGQTADDDTIHRGTQNGKTVAQLLKKHGEKALTGEKSILGGVEALGIKVFPAKAAFDSQKENPKFGGGFTVQTYGSHATDGIDAIQLELGADLRAKQREKLVKDLATSISAFYSEYVKGEVRR
jgi:N-formylglutamate amidohydrolase